MNQNSQRYVWCSSYPPSGKVAAIATERANADLSSLRDVKEGLKHCQIEYKIMPNEPELTEICMLPLIPPFSQICCHCDGARGRGPLVSSGR